MSAQTNVHQRGKFISLILTRSTTQQNLGELQIMEWKMNYFFQYRFFVDTELIFKMYVLQFLDEQWAYHPLISKYVSIVTNFATFIVDSVQECR